jgi:protein SCO1/2
VNKSLSPSTDPTSPTEGLPQTFLASLLALLLGLAAIFFSTDHGHAFTTESLRRSEVERQPVLIPDLPVISADGRKLNLRQWMAADGRVWIVDFVYTRCQTVCSSLGSVYQQLQAQILARDLHDRVGLLSISFDPAHDDAAALSAYASRMRMNAGAWKVVSLESVPERQLLLDAFGIMVVPAPLNEFEHNAALHIVDGNGRLVRIMDYDAPGRALDFAISLTQ